MLGLFSCWYGVAFALLYNARCDGIDGVFQRLNHKRALIIMLCYLLRICNAQIMINHVHRLLPQNAYFIR